MTAAVVYERDHGRAPAGRLYILMKGYLVVFAALAAVLSSPPAGAQSSHRYEAEDPNAPAGARAAAQPAPRPAGSGRFIRVSRPGMVQAAANVEPAGAVSAGGEVLGGAGLGVGSKDKAPGVNAATGGGSGGGGGGGGGGSGSLTKSPGGSTLKPAAANAAAPNAAKPKRGVRVVDEGKAPLPSNSFYDSQTVYFQIFGYDKDDTSICLESLAMIGGLPKDCAEFVKLPDATYAISYHNGQFAFANGVWEARYKSINRYDTIRVSVKDSKGDKSVQTFTTLGMEKNPSPMNRYFVNGKMKNPPYRSGEAVEVRVYGFAENDTYVCTQIRDDAAYRANSSELSSCSSYGDFSTFARMPAQGWVHEKGVWTKTYKDLRLDTTYYVRFRSSKNVELPTMLQAMSSPPGFTVGPQ